jgi:hypothetical protein
MKLWAKLQEANGMMMNVEKNKEYTRSTTESGLRRKK